MMGHKCLLAFLLFAHLAVLSLSSPDAAATAAAQPEKEDQLDSGRRLVVRKRKRPAGTGPPVATAEDALTQLIEKAEEKDSRDGRSLIGNTPFQPFGQRIDERHLLPGPNPFQARGASIHQQQAELAQRVQNAVVQHQPHAQHVHVEHQPQVVIPDVPGLREHQLALQQHEAQIQAHLAGAGGPPPLVPLQHHQVAPQVVETHVHHHVPAPVPPPPVVEQPLAIVEHSVHHGVPALATGVLEHHVAQVEAAPVVPVAPVAPVVHLEPIPVRQGVPEPQLIDIGAVAVAGEKCVDKIVAVEETQTDEHVECHHSYDKKCHTTYTTDFDPQQEEKCEENFKKNCFIEYKKVTVKEPVQFCHTPLVKDCNQPGPVECKTEYESECMTRYHKHVVEEDIPECKTIKERKCETKTVGYSTEEDCTDWPVERCNVRKEVTEKSSPETSCKKVPKEKCAPAGCGFVPGPEECFDKMEAVIQEVPEEKCDLEPQKQCKHVTTLVPNLKPSEECVDVPKETCVRSNENPRKVMKPVVKKWCYTPTPESGLFR